MHSIVNDQQAKEILNEWGNEIWLPEDSGNWREEIQFPKNLAKFKDNTKCSLIRLGRNRLKFEFIK